MVGLYVFLGSLTARPADSPDVADEPTQEVVSELTYEAVPSAVQNSVERNSYLIETIPDLIDQIEEQVRDQHFLPAATKIFEVVFEHIISPNSP